MNKIRLFINPFERWSESKLISYGFIFLFLGSTLAYFLKSRFDNFLHISFVPSLEFYQPFVDNILILMCLSFFLYIAGIIQYPKTRFIDILATVLIGNAPFYLLSLTNINDFGFEATQNVLNMNLENPESIPADIVIYFAIVSIFSIIILIWAIALLYNGFKRAVNAKGIKAIILFVIAIILTIATTSFLPLNY